MVQLVKVSSLSKGDIFSFVNDSSKVFEFCRYCSDYDYILYKSGSGRLEIASVDYCDEVYKHLKYRVTRVTEVKFDCEFDRANGILSSITKSIKQIEASENCIVEPLVTKPDFRQRKFSLSDSCYLNNLEDFVVLTFTSKLYNKPYVFQLYKSKN